MNKTTVIFILIAIIFFSAGVGVGFLTTSKLEKQRSSKINPEAFNAPDTFEAGWEAAKKRVESSNIIQTVIGETKSLKGKIVKKAPGIIKIETRLLNPLDDESLKIRVVEVDESTQIIIREEKSRETIRKEHEEYNKKMEDFRNGKIKVMPEVPEISNERVGSIEDLEVGQRVVVESEENIKEAPEFKASKVLVR